MEKFDQVLLSNDKYANILCECNFFLF